ncbi:MAG: DUF3256 family protein [Bacteroidales bacterium]|nr:DUF3256 family protein [Candidatus Minthousia equi]
MKMKRYFILLVLAMFFSVNGKAQTMRDAFTNMPDSLLPLLTHNDRMDMMDFLDSKMQARVTNRLTVQSEMDTLTADYLHLKMTEISKVEMKLLPVNDSTQVIAVVHTVTIPAIDSSIRFYSSDWKELRVTDYVQLPNIDAFLAKDKRQFSEEEEALLKGLDLELVGMALSSSESKLVLTRSLGQLSREEQKKAKSLFKPITLLWKEGKFILIKSNNAESQSRVHKKPQSYRVAVFVSQVKMLLLLLRSAVAARELINTTSGINQLALTSIEWVRS